MPNIWPLSASLGGQYACDVPLSLAAPHLNFLSNSFELNYATSELVLPYFSHETFDFNESGLDAGNLHYFPNLFFVELEEQVEGNPEPNMYCDDSSDSGSQSRSSKYEMDSGILSDSDPATVPTPNSSYVPVFTSLFLSVHSRHLIIQTLLILFFLVFLS